MTRTRQELENEIWRARNRLEDAERDLRIWDTRPVGCVCDPRDWGCTPGPVCEEFLNDHDPMYDGECEKCEHLRECHREPPR